MAEIIEEGMNVITKPKNFKKFLPFILIGGGLGVIALIRKNSSQNSSGYVATDDTGVGGNVAGVITDQTNQTINDAISANNEKISSAFEKVSSDIDYSRQQYSAIYSTLTDLTQDMNNIKNNPVLQRDKSDVITPDTNTPISQKVATNSTSVNGLFASQTFLDPVIDDKDQKKMDANGALWKASNDKANQLTVQAKNTTDKNKQAELLKQASTYKQMANDAHNANEKIREQYGFSGGSSGNEYIKK